MSIKEEKYLEVSIVAKRFSVSERTVMRMLNDPKHPLKGIRISSRCIRVAESSVFETLKQREITTQ